ncbi:MAG: hypothetical protein NZ482_08965, partial [Gloeomargarita sp. SKYG98]|nr:hypothetical protein [Gloeomargarita sp. SKYG98]
TSAVDVGVDFRIHLLITESSDAATVIQRLGRLGRHPGFSAYHAYVLISGSTPWVMARLQQQLQAEQVVERSELVAAIQEAFDPPRAFPEYQQRWGALQAQGLLWQMGGENQAVMQPIRQRLVEDFQKLYGPRVQPWLGAWRDLEKTDLGRAVQQELLRFRGGTTLQAAVWDGESFYTYDLLRLLPYVQVDVLSREDFLQAAAQAGWSELAFPEPWIHLYVRVQRWEIERLPWTLRCNHHTDDLAVGELTLLSRVSVQGHPQDRAINRVLARQKLLGFLVPLTAQQSPFDVRRHLRLSPLFGLYPLHDGDNQPFACAFNQDALLLEALKGRLAPFLRTHRPSLIF